MSKFGSADKVSGNIEIRTDIVEKEEERKSLSTLKV